jgi:DNA invertase Pin-like site-specific DNA recombinase
METKKRQAYAYVRVSTAIQSHGHGIARQTASPAAYAATHNFDLIEIIEDVGLSAYTGRNLAEGQLGKLVQRIKKGQIAAGSALLIESLDRLSRQEPILALNTLTAIVDSGVSVITLDDGQVLTAERLKSDFASLLISLSTMYRSHQESALKSERLKSAWQNKRDNASGKILTAKAPAWLRLSDDKSRFIRIPDRARTVKRSFLYRRKGMDRHPSFTHPACMPLRFSPAQ